MFNPARTWPFGLDRPGKARVVVLILACFAAMTLIDGPVAYWARGLPEFVRGVFLVVTRAGNSDWFLIPTLVIALTAAVASRMPFTGRARAFFVDLAVVDAFMFSGVAVPGVIVNLIKSLVGRARPVGIDEFGVFHLQPLAWDWRFQSFPSGDTTTIFAIAVVVTCLVPRLRPWAFGAAALVAVSRIMVGMHFPSDVLGGVFLGTITAYAVRNFWLRRGWLFTRDAAGNVIRKPAWWEREKSQGVSR